MSEIFYRLLHVIQLPEMKAPGKQEKLIIDPPYVPGSEARQQSQWHFKLASVSYYTACSDAKVFQK